MSYSVSIVQHAVEANTADAAPFHHRLIAKVVATWAAWGTWRRHRRDEVLLKSMNDRMLKDIGLTRSEIGDVVRFGRRGD